MDTQFAPETESYLPEPAFEFAPTQVEVDFARLVAAGGDPVEALVYAGVVPRSELTQENRPELYDRACRLINRRSVQERLDYYRILHEKSMEVTCERIQQEAAAIAFVDIASFFDEEGRPLVNPHEMPRHARAALKKFKIDKDGVVHLDLHDKLKAVQMLGDMEGLFDEANAAKAPQVTVNLDGLAHAPAPSTPAEEATVVSSPDPPIPSELPDCLL